MSWYSSIYTQVRFYRQKNPCRGWLISKCLNVLLLVQFAGLFASLYVYVFHICGHLLSSGVQASIYVCTYMTLAMMGLWSLLTTVLWPVRQVPGSWKMKKERLEELEKVTPKEGDRYVVEKSTAEQTTEQKKILELVVKETGCQQAECDQAGRQKFCFPCGHLKPDRTHHCSSCGHCVVHFDHHCPWINHCVNQANYKFFLLYLVYAVSIIVWFLLGALEALVRFSIRQQWEEDWFSVLLILVLMVPFAIFGYFPLGEMLIYHWGLISINETTCEQAKPAVLRNDFQADYNMGRWNNIRQVFGPYLGLWAFPVPTTREDGMHFQIRYVDCPRRQRLRRVEVRTSPDPEAPEPKVAGNSKASVVFEKEAKVPPKVEGVSSLDNKVEK